jgi:CxxC motif-containing protein (DUF1111 family)
MKQHNIAPFVLASAIAGSPFLFMQEVVSQTTSAPATTSTSFTARDPGVRAGTYAGAAMPNMTPKQYEYFEAAKAEFASAETIPEGLGPRMNLDSCGGCHAFPVLGGTSPAHNPQVDFIKGSSNSLPSFITPNGPVREARFVKNSDGTPDGGVHSIFTIVGRVGATGCTIAQPDFAHELAMNNVIFRIPTPMYGLGLVEQIPDSAILANQASNAAAKQALGIRGRSNIVQAGNTMTGQPNLNGNDGTIARFGWKAQNKSLLLFSGEAYNVEMGISNELFQTERDETPTCQFATTPNDVTDTEALTPADALNGLQKFAMFMRFLAPPTPSPTTPGGAPSITRGSNLFSLVGCSQCHTPTLVTGKSTITALSQKPANLYSDLLIHDMGPGLADGISQGQAGPSEFRTAPLWGLGQRIFFLHDGRTNDLITAIRQHQSGSTRSSDASEANAVVTNFNRLSEPDKQHLLNFLRSL